MGYFVQEFVYVIAWEKIQKLENFVKSHPKLFISKPSPINGYYNYIMIWDGSKEGWDDSEVGNELREQFLKLCDNSCDIYHVKEPEDDEPRLVKRISSKVVP